MLKTSHISSVVADLDAVMAFYTDIMGVGPFDVQDVEALDARWGNIAAPGAWRVASAPFGPAEMEIIQVVDGHPPHLKFLQTYGEGMNHVCWETADGDAYGALMMKLGQEAGLFPYWGFPENGFAYVYSEKVAGGVSIEVIRKRRGFNHFGIAVHDNQKTAQFLNAAFGIEDRGDHMFPCKGLLYDGERINATFRVGFTPVGDARLEFIQPLHGDTPFQRQLDSRGEGLHHLRIDVPDLDEAYKKAEAANAVAEWQSDGLGRVQCNSRAIGGMTIVLART